MGMIDKKKVVEEFEHLLNIAKENYQDFVDLTVDGGEEILALLKGKETKYPVCEKCGKKIDHIVTSVFNYDGSDSEYSFPITYDEEGGCIQFSTTQNWTGYELSDIEQKDGIRCPFCHEFPFDANEEIELYEPDEVVVMMWEGR